MTDLIKFLGTSCLVCGSNSWLEFLYPGLLKCGSCSFVTADVAMTKEDMLSLYGHQYFCGDEYVNYITDKKIMQRNFRRRLRTVRKYVPSGFLVEVGCAYGFFLELAKEHFRVLGYDVSPEAVEYANRVFRVPARCEDFLLDDTLTPGSVDVIAMWDVIEHLTEPAQFVERAAELLRVGGHLFLTTGDLESWLPRCQGARWRLIHPPTHLHYFSRRTISRLLNLKGLEVVQVRYPGYWRSIDEILHGLFVLGKRRSPPVLYQVLRDVLPRKMGVYINVFDIMCVVARRAVTT